MIQTVFGSVSATAEPQLIFSRERNLAGRAAFRTRCVATGTSWRRPYLMAATGTVKVDFRFRHRIREGLRFKEIRECLAH